jgi:hypothetical protein
MAGEPKRSYAAWISLGVLTLSLFVRAQEKKIARSRLPLMVEKTVEGLEKNATVRGFSKEIEHGLTYYEAELIVTGHHKDFLMDSAGNVVESKSKWRWIRFPRRSRTGCRLWRVRANCWALSPLPSMAI